MWYGMLRLEEKSAKKRFPQRELAQTLPPTEMKATTERQERQVQNFGRSRTHLKEKIIHTGQIGNALSS